MAAQNRTTIYENFVLGDFVASCLRQEKPSTTFSIRILNEEYIIFGSVVDTEDKRIIVDISFSNNGATIIDRIAKYSKTKNEVWIVGLWSLNTGFNNIPINIHIYGYDFIQNLISKYPVLWWSFVAVVSDNAKIQLNRNAVGAVLKSEVHGIKLNAYLKLEQIDDISVANEHELMRLINISHKKPALFVGNGVSIPFGSDTWQILSEHIFDYMHPFYIDQTDAVKTMIGGSNYAITSLTNDILEKEKFDELLWFCIYRKYDKSVMHLDSTIIRSITEIKHTNPNLPILTYNYDEFLENDFAVKYPSFKIESVLDKASYKKKGEPKITHIHGIVRCNKGTAKYAKKLVLTDDDYYKAYSNSSWVKRIQKEHLLNNICLFVGSSMSDFYQMSLINEVRSRSLLKVNKTNNKEIWKCFAILCLKGLTAKDKLSVINYYLHKGIYLIFVDDFSKIPGKLMSLLNHKINSLK